MVHIKINIFDHFYYLVTIFGPINYGPPVIIIIETNQTLTTRHESNIHLLKKKKRKREHY